MRYSTYITMHGVMSAKNVLLWDSPFIKGKNKKNGKALQDFDLQRKTVLNETVCNEVLDDTSNAQEPRGWFFLQMAV